MGQKLTKTGLAGTASDPRVGGVGAQLEVA